MFSSRQLFDQGYESFSRTFPNFAAKVEQRSFYVCPQCLRAFHEVALSMGLLTQEHVPPESVGGKRLVLTCVECNCTAGHEMDSDMRREADVLDFFGKRLTEIQATLKTASGRVPIRLSASEGQILLFGVPKAAHPAESEALKADFNKASQGEGWRDFKMNIEFPRFSPARAEASWLRSAYLAFFAACGYRFVVRPELSVVRQRLGEPNTKAFSFRMVRPDVVCEPVLMAITEPDVFRSFAMCYGQQVVFLPLYGDDKLYTRLAAQPAGHVEIKSDHVYAWPTRPTFLHDRQADVVQTPT